MKMDVGVEPAAAGLTPAGAAQLRVTEVLSMEWEVAHHARDRWPRKSPVHRDHRGELCSGPRSERGLADLRWGGMAERGSRAERACRQPCTGLGVRPATTAAAQHLAAGCTPLQTSGGILFAAGRHLPLTARAGSNDALLRHALDSAKALLDCRDTGRVNRRNTRGPLGAHAAWRAPPGA